MAEPWASPVSRRRFLEGVGDSALSSLAARNASRPLARHDDAAATRALFTRARHHHDDGEPLFRPLLGCTQHTNGGQRGSSTPTGTASPIHVPARS